jgi:glycosyltransferase A (GT-A) superfamily protein (DUF2064 family)
MQTDTDCPGPTAERLRIATAQLARHDVLGQAEDCAIPC